jgi:hypothetical protein
MLAAEMASTIAKPSMIFARNRKVGSFSDIDCGRACFDNPTSNSRPVLGNQQNRERKLPGPKQKSKGEWIKGRKPYRAGGDCLAVHKMMPFGWILQVALYGTSHGRRRPDQMMVQCVTAAAPAAVPGHRRVKRRLPPFSQGSTISPTKLRQLLPRCGIRFAEENAPLYNFARILSAKPLSTGAETALLPLINGKTTCSINQPHNLPPAPLARWPVFVLSNLPASDLVPSHA